MNSQILRQHTHCLVYCTSICMGIRIKISISRSTIFLHFPTSVTKTTAARELPSACSEFTQVAQNYNFHFLTKIHGGHWKLISYFVSSIPHRWLTSTDWISWNICRIQRSPFATELLLRLSSKRLLNPLKRCIYVNYVYTFVSGTV